MVGMDTSTSDLPGWLRRQTSAQPNQPGETFSSVIEQIKAYVTCPLALNLSQPFHFLCVNRNTVFFTRSSKMNLNDVSHIISLNSSTSVAMKNKGFKLYVATYINNYEGKFRVAYVIAASLSQTLALIGRSYSIRIKWG